MVKSNRLRVFPCNLEIPALMKQFIRWRDEIHSKNALHPLILACHSFIYFKSIHPFVDGNGRVGRTLMQDYMIRQGYIPVIYENLDRGGYIQTV
jgi:Fic family protein